MDRVELRYTGTGPVELMAGQGAPSPQRVEPGGTVTVDKAWAASYLGGPDFTVAGHVEGPKGAELDAALDAAGLDTSGTADEKRARLAAHTEGA